MLSVLVVLLASVYPIYMGFIVVYSHIRYGGINFADYPSYIIPYTPVCIAVMLCVALLPLIYRYCKRFALLVVSGLGAATFLISELIFEKIVVFVERDMSVPVEGWQWYMCILTPTNQIRAGEISYDVTKTLGLQYSPLFKIHFYAIALLIVITVIGVAYGFYKMSRTQDFTKRKPLIAQLICVAGFIGLCILACFTAFFRTGDINVSPISAVLMTVFFLLFGITSGVYAGTWLYGRRKLFSVIIPSLIAVVMAIVMYIGEMVMLDWQLFRFGTGFLFSGLGFIPLSIFDLLTILLSGAVTWLVLMRLITNNYTETNHEIH